MLLALTVPRASGAACSALEGSAPAISKLFDPCAPHTHTLTTQLGVIDASLAVSITLTGPTSTADMQGVSEPVPALPTLPSADGSRTPYLAPGATASIHVHVTDSLSSDNIAEAEVTLIAVDKALLDVLPYPLPRLAESLRLSLAATFGPAGVDASRLAPGAVEEVFEALLTR